MFFFSETRCSCRKSVLCRLLTDGAGARGPAAVAADVPAALPHRAGPAAAQSALLGRVVAQYRRAEPDTAQHAVRPQDPHDYLSRHSARRAHAVALGHRQLDPASLREVGRPRT